MKGTETAVSICTMLQYSIFQLSYWLHSRTNDIWRMRTVATFHGTQVLPNQGFRSIITINFSIVVF